MTPTRRETTTTGGATALLLVGLAAAVTLAFGAGAAAAAPAATQRATNTCWKQVVNDWLQHRPNVVGTYAIPCYTQAIQHLNAYPDIQGYSSAPDDIHRALLAAYRANQPNGPTSSADSSNDAATTTTTSSKSAKSGKGNNSNNSSASPLAGGPNNGGGGSPPPAAKSIVTRAFDAVGPGNAQSIPLPLLVLAGLALLLLLAAAGTWLAKRLQQRRMTPATVPAPAPHERR